MVDLYDDRLHVHYGFFDLVKADGIPEATHAYAGQGNGLCGTNQPGQISCRTGLHTGKVGLRIEWLSSAPEVDADWEDIVEASVEFPERQIELSSFNERLPLELPDTGWHRVRYCATGMDAGHQLDNTAENEPAPDRYLLQLWPAPKAPDSIISQSSQQAAYWHGIARRDSGS